MPAAPLEGGGEGADPWEAGRLIMDELERHTQEVEAWEAALSPQICLRLSALRP